MVNGTRAVPRSSDTWTSTYSAVSGQRRRGWCETQPFGSQAGRTGPLGDQASGARVQLLSSYSCVVPHLTEQLGEQLLRVITAGACLVIAMSCSLPLVPASVYFTSTFHAVLRPENESLI